MSIHALMHEALVHTAVVHDHRRTARLAMIPGSLPSGYVWPHRGDVVWMCACHSSSVSASAGVSVLAMKSAAASSESKVGSAST